MTERTTSVTGFYSSLHLRLSISLLLLLAGTLLFWLSTQRPQLAVRDLHVGAPSRSEAPSTPIDVSDQVTADEYAVYSAALTDPRYINSSVQSVVIRDRTFQYPVSDKESAFDHVADKIPEIRDDTIKDFAVRNRREQYLEDRFNLGVDTVIVNSKELDDLFDKDFFAAWKTVHAKYKHSSGIISFSSIGFDLPRSQALVYVALSCGSKCGEGRFFLLKKERGIWAIQSKLTVSRS